MELASGGSEDGGTPGVLLGELREKRQTRMRRVSRNGQKYTGPNGSVMRLSAQPNAGADPHLDRYLMLNTFYFETRN